VDEPGIIRNARRPPGGQAPGPAPRGADGRPELLPGPGEDLCYLSGDWRILQRVHGHRWAVDDLVTAYLAARAITPRRFLDLGCGLGSVLMMVAWRFPEARGVGIEAQPLSLALVRRSLAYNGADDRVEVRAGDLREQANDGPIYDLVTGTPPYFARGSGIESDVEQRARARFEHRGGADDYVAAAAASLAPGGRFVLCGGALQAARVAAAVTAAGLAIHERVELVPRAGKDPLLALHVCAWEPAPRVDRQLTVRDESGAWTPEYVEVRRAMGLPPSPP